jgi:hypothetical protein
MFIKIMSKYEIRLQEIEESNSNSILKKLTQDPNLNVIEPNLKSKFMEDAKKFDIKFVYTNSDLLIMAIVCYNLDDFSKAFKCYERWIELQKCYNQQFKPKQIEQINQYFLFGENYDAHFSMESKKEKIEISAVFCHKNGQKTQLTKTFDGKAFDNMSQGDAEILLQKLANKLKNIYEKQTQQQQQQQQNQENQGLNQNQ